MAMRSAPFFLVLGVVACHVFTLAPGGTWTAGSGEGLALGGSSRAIGKGGRKLALEFDPASAADFATDRGRDIASLCEVADVVVQSVTATSFVLALNRKRTRATLLVVYRLMAAAGGVDRRATFRLRAAGRWTPG